MGDFGKFLEKSFAKRMGEKHLEKSLGKLKGILEKYMLGYNRID